MSKCAKEVSTDECRTDSYNLIVSPPQLQTNKERWIQHYAERMLSLWLQWQTPLGVSCAYVEHLKKELSGFYEIPLKKMFVETTY